MPSIESEPKSTPVATPAAPSHRTAVLGPSITIKGTLAGKEDLLIEGHVEGEVSFKKHAVTIGKKGRIDADMFCKSIFVEGEVNGNLYGDDLVVVRSSARVKGNAVAPRVSLEDGAQFQGSIDMRPKEAPAATPPANRTATNKDAPGGDVASPPKEAAIRK